MTAETIAPEAAAPLRLLALDAEDLAVVSAHLQSATVRVGDMAYWPELRRFALVASRFDWAGAQRGGCERCASGLQFERVERVRRIGFDQSPDTELTLLAAVFVPGKAPSGTVMLSFGEGRAVRLEVECLDAALSDLGPRWSADAAPGEPEILGSDG